VQQQSLLFPDIPSPHETVWAQLNPTQRAAVIEMLARLIAQSARPDDAPPEEPHHD
jgi:hypothetical protein